MKKIFTLSLIFISALFLTLAYNNCGKRKDSEKFVPGKRFLHSCHYRFAGSTLICEDIYKSKTDFNIEHDFCLVKKVIYDTFDPALLDHVVHKNKKCGSFYDASYFVEELCRYENILRGTRIFEQADIYSNIRLNRKWCRNYKHTSIDFYKIYIFDEKREADSFLEMNLGVKKSVTDGNIEMFVNGRHYYIFDHSSTPYSMLIEAGVVVYKRSEDREDLYLIKRRPINLKECSINKSESFGALEWSTADLLEKDSSFDGNLKSLSNFSFKCSTVMDKDGFLVLLKTNGYTSLFNQLKSL